MLSYDWIKILACIAAGIFLWSLIFTTTAARLNPAQTFTVYAYIGTNPTGEFSSKVTSRSALSGGFSYDVIETSVVDLTTAGNQAYTLLEARMGVQEGNAAFVSPRSYEIDDGKAAKYPARIWKIFFFARILPSFRSAARAKTQEMRKLRFLQPPKTF